jgi:hypothetical protein
MGSSVINHLDDEEAMIEENARQERIRRYRELKAMSNVEQSSFIINLFTSTTLCLMIYVISCLAILMGIVLASIPPFDNSCTALYNQSVRTTILPRIELYIRQLNMTVE